MSQNDTTRRRFLQALAAGAAGASAGLAGLPEAWAQAVKKKKGGEPPAPTFHTKHIVFVLMGGGVRTRDVFAPAVSEKHEDCPTINTIAKAGLLCRSVKVRDIGHYGSALTLLTGVDQKPIKEDTRGTDPTIFELVRRAKKLPGQEVWISAAGADWHSNLSFSQEKSFGVRWGANYVAGDGAFTAELADVTNQFGEPKVADAAEKTMLDLLGAKIDPSVAKATNALRPPGAPPDVQERVRKYVMDELSGNVRRIEAPSLRDIMAIHYGTNLLAVFKPTLLNITLVYPALAQNNRDRYHQVLRKDDQELARLWETIQKDPELKATTTVVIVPDFGRNSQDNAKGGLSHDDNGKDHREVFLVMAGPDTKKGEFKTSIDATDITPTLLHLLGIKFQPLNGKTGGRVLTEFLN